MLELCRTIRFCLNDDASPSRRGARDNTFSAWPAMRGLGRYYELHVACVGAADAATGYFMNIKHMDAAVREYVLPVFKKTLANGSRTADFPMGGLMRSMFEALGPPLNDTMVMLGLSLTPRYTLTLRSQDMNRVEIAQQYEFSAAHRLHVDALSDAENREVFGKCNNPAGHGHNYRAEVVVSVPINDEGHIAWVEQLDKIVNEHAIEKLDHKHLNYDVPQFSDRNPSVEHIAQVVWDMLVDTLGPIAGELKAVSIWETGKTVCTYRGQ